MQIKLIVELGMVLALAAPAFGQANAGQVEQWGTFEVTVKGAANQGNPFVDVQVGAKFSLAGGGSAGGAAGGGAARPVEVGGFYDGDGNYVVRFMPPAQGRWTYETTSNRAELAGKKGEFTVGAPTGNNHGPVHVARTFHFDYADGTPYFSIGTTCYAWQHEEDPMEERTLATLKESPFNKVRMCILPTRFPSKRQLYPYIAKNTVPAGTMPEWDYTRFNPAFFQHLEKRVADLRDLNIEADVILYTPYESATGFNGANREGKGLDAAGDERYLKYVVARLASYRNIWWSMANEYDLMARNTPAKAKDAYWDQLCQIVKNADPSDHLLSIHFSNRIYNSTHPWITHISVQNGEAVEDFGRALLYRDVYYKPVVFDEVRYEGNIAQRWGRLTPQEMVEYFWHGTIDGTYVGHGETYGGDQANWISRGGTLEGQSPPRLAFLKKVMETFPKTGVNPIDKWQNVHVAGKPGEYYLWYFGREKPTQWPVALPKAGLQAGAKFRIEILDTWNMTVTPVAGPDGGNFTVASVERYEAKFAGNPTIALPGTPYLALRITAVR
jgi:hypothetical protein